MITQQEQPKSGVLRFTPGLVIEQITDEKERYGDNFGALAVAKVANHISHSSRPIQLAIACGSGDGKQVIRVLTYQKIEGWDEDSRCHEYEIRVTESATCDPKNSGHSVVQPYEDVDDPAVIAANVYEDIFKQMCIWHEPRLKPFDFQVFLVTKSVPSEVVGWSGWVI